MLAPVVFGWLLFFFHAFPVHVHSSIGQSGIDDELSAFLFVSHQTGKDSSRCGSPVAPCQTLHAALQRVSEGGQIYLDGRDGESHTYGCERMNRGKKMTFIQIPNNITVQGWRGRPHISCIKPFFSVFKNSRNSTIWLNISNLVFRRGVALRFSSFHVIITNCTFMNSKAAFAILQDPDLSVSGTQSSSLVISDSEFLNNSISVLVILYKGIFTFNISRCVFQGKVGHFNGTSSSITSEAAVYVNLLEKSRNTKAKAIGFITNSVFRELGHESNGFALSFLTNDSIFTTGTLVISNTTFLKNKNAILVAGGFNVQLVNMKIDSTHGNAILLQNKFYTVSSEKSPSLVISDSEFLNNKVSVLVILFKGILTLNISRCLFQGKVGHFNGTSSNITSEAAVQYFILHDKSRNTKAKAIGFISNSVFRELGHENNGFALSFLTNDSIFTTGTLVICNTTFFKNKNAVLVAGGLNVQLVNVKIDSTNGSAIKLLNKPSTVSSVKSPSLAISDSEFLNNNVSVLVFLQAGNFTLNISRCVFQGKVRRFPGNPWDKTTMGAVYVKLLNKPRDTTIQAFAFITDSIFRELGHSDNGFALSFRTYDNIFNIGALKIFNTTFLTNENAIFVAGGFDVRLVKVTINSTYGYAFIAGGPPKTKEGAVEIKASLDHCIFWNNRIGVRMATITCFDALDCGPSSQSLVVKNSLFIGGNETRGIGDAIRFQVYSSFSHRPSFLKGEVILENVTFKELHNSALYVRIQKNVKGLVSVKSCRFVNNSALGEEPTVNIKFDDEDPPKCSNESHNNELIWNNRMIPVTFEDCVFEGNIGISGALNVWKGNISFKNCIFKDNEGLTVGGHIYMKTGFGILHIVNSTFLQTRLNHFSDAKQPGMSGSGCFLYSESTGPLIISNSSFTANVSRVFHPLLQASASSKIKIDDATFLQCPPRMQVKIDKVQQSSTQELQLTGGNKTCWIKLNYFKESCEVCPGGFYSFQRGLATGFNINTRTVCLECPYGARCENGNVKAKENFWGINVSASLPKMQFFSCPSEYCGSPSDSSQYVYNYCLGNRTGVLCGKCSDGYSEALYSTFCRKNEQCHDHWFWLATIIYVVFLALYLVFKPPIFSELYRQSLWFTRKTERFDVQPLQPNNHQEHDPGYLKITFYFYQVVELVMVSSPEKAFTMVPIIPPVIAIFNFQVKTLNGSIGCPFPGLTVVTKALFQCLKFLGTLLSIGFIYAIHQAASRLRYVSAPSLSLYLAVALETLLLGYERLADTTLKLMHCVPIDKDWRLFVDGNILCWQWWQLLMIAFIVAFIIPLILVLFWGSLLLAKDRLTNKAFLLACAFPLPCLVAWIIWHLKKTDIEGVVSHSDTGEIKKVLHGPFREGRTGNHGTLYWESVLTGRRLVLLIIHTFATDPIIRFVCLNCACVLILVHHLIMRPFRDRKANICEGFSLLSLVVICSFSLAEAAYISEGIDPIGARQNLFHAFQWIEIVLLGMLPAAACLLVVFATLSQVVRLLYLCGGCLFTQVIGCTSLFSYSWMPQRLLFNWERDQTLAM